MTVTLVLSLVMLAGPAAVDTTAAGEIERLGHEIAARHESAFDRAGAVYHWVATNIAYDVDGYYSGVTAASVTAEATWRRRTAVCEGFANLYISIARAAGVEAIRVDGYAKGFDYLAGASSRRPNHAWVAFRVHGAWKLADPTWGAGHVADRTFVPSFTWWYFDPPAAALALSHHPRDSRWQLLRKPIGRREFEALTAVPQAVLASGLPPAAIRREAARRGHQGFPIAVADLGTTIFDAPLQANLNAGSTYRFILAWPAASRVVVVNGDIWTDAHRNDDGTWEVSVKAAPGQLLVAGLPESAEAYVTLLSYGVR
jgi:hypothetical protein